MLREKYFIRQMHGLYIGVLFIQRGRYIWIDGSISWEIQSVIDVFFDIDTVILSGVFLSHFDILMDSNVGSFLNLTEETVIKARAPVKCMEFVNCQQMLFVDWVDNDISSFLEDLLIDFIVPVVIDYFLRLGSLFSKRESYQTWFCKVVLRVVKIRTRLHL